MRKRDDLVERCLKRQGALSREGSQTEKRRPALAAEETGGFTRRLHVANGS